MNTASFVAVMGSATSQISYTASKGGVLAMSRELGVQFAREGIRVNALCPGPVNTPLLRELFAADPERAQRRLVHVPMGRFAERRRAAAVAPGDGARSSPPRRPGRGGSPAPMSLPVSWRAGCSAVVAGGTGGTAACRHDRLTDVQRCVVPPGRATRRLELRDASRAAGCAPGRGRADLASPGPGPAADRAVAGERVSADISFWGRWGTSGRTRCSVHATCDVTPPGGHRDSCCGSRDGPAPATGARWT